MNGGRRAKVAILLAAALSLPGVATAKVQTGNAPEPCSSPSPSPSPTETPLPPSPSPTESPSPSPSPSPTEPEDCPTPSPSPKPDPSPDDDPDRPKDEDEDDEDSPDKKPGKGKGDGEEEFEEPEYLRLRGAYSTDVLMAVAAQLRALGWSADEIVPRVYAPFIIGGEANWIDTWGAPRYGPGPVIRTHEGQDVFCDYGDPVLASESGIVDYGDGGLGGVVARLHRPGGGYWYYAHLAATNEPELPAGSKVKQGDVIGFCGNSGNAISTPAHVHFGFYKANGEAKNPMRALTRWLREARSNALDVLARAQGKRVAQIDSLTAARMFGEAVAPGLSEVRINVHSVALAEEKAALHLVDELLPAADVAGDSGSRDEAKGRAVTPSRPAREESAD